MQTNYENYIELNDGYHFESIEEMLNYYEYEMGRLEEIQAILKERFNIAISEVS